MGSPPFTLLYPDALSKCQGPIKLQAVALAMGLKQDDVDFLQPIATTSLSPRE